MAEYAVLIYDNDSAHALDATAADIEECDEHADELVASKSMVLAYALTPRNLATSIRADGITDGPFIDGKEIVAGFNIIEAADLDAASGHRGHEPGRARWRRRGGAAGAQRRPGGGSDAVTDRAALEAALVDAHDREPNGRTCPGVTQPTSGSADGDDHWHTPDGVRSASRRRVRSVTRATGVQGALPPGF